LSIPMGALLLAVAFAIKIAPKDRPHLKRN
jgi:hypothetical protein